MTKWYDHTFFKAASIVYRHREWFRREAGAYDLHPSVKRLLLDDNRPRNWQMLLLEWPHVAQTDRERLAYTRDERSGEANRQTLTSVGKYLMRHFDLPDHVIRDAVAQYIGGTDTYKILRTVDEMVHAVNNGPHSCMCWSQRDFLRCSDGEYRHPYAAYDPEYGWHMAVRVSPSGEIVGRALLNKTHGGQMYWVRSFAKQEGSSYSYTDEKLEVWLKDQGYVRHHSWHDSAQLAHIPTRYGFLAPYLDGDTRHATLTYKDELYIDEDGDYELRNTDGTAEQQGRFTCPDCGERCDEEDTQCVGYHGDHTVCSDCCDNNYIHAIGRRGDEYYVPNEDAVEVDGSWYVYDYLGDNNIVELANGDYTHSDNAVRCDDDDEWYHVDDPDMIFCEYDEKYHHIGNCVETEDEGWVHGDDAWQCYASDKYYSDNTDHVLIDGCMYHPDNAPEQEETETNTQE